MATCVGRDARQRGAAVQNSLRWALIALLDAHHYWWGARLEMMADDEAEALLHRAAREHGLASVTNIRCPLWATR